MFSRRSKINATNDTPNGEWMQYKYSIKIQIKSHGKEEKIQTLIFK
jgi:hypothetical protein